MVILKNFQMNRWIQNKKDRKEIIVSKFSLYNTANVFNSRIRKLNPISIYLPVFHNYYLNINQFSFFSTLTLPVSIPLQLTDFSFFYKLETTEYNTNQCKFKFFFFFNVTLLGKNFKKKGQS